MIRVGLVGASIPRHGWAIVAHAPALRALDRFSLHAVATTRRETAEQAANALGAELAFSSALELAQHPEVDLVVVAVRVTEHRDVVRAALAAGKHVYCEWPLGIDAAEAEGLEALARAAGVVNAIGLQARAAPAIRYARALIDEGYVGALRSATLLASSPQPGGRVLPERWAWHADRRNGLTTLTIPGSHALDAFFFCTGDPVSLAAVVARMDPEPTIEETGATIERTSDDHIAITATLPNGAPVVAQIQGGADAAIGSMIEVRGTEGALRIRTTQPTQLQMSALALDGARGSDDYAPLALPDAFTAHVPAELRLTPAENVAAVYAGIAAAIEDGTPVQADFALASARHRLLETIERSSTARRWESTGAPAQPSAGGGGFAAA